MPISTSHKNLGVEIKFTSFALYYKLSEFKFPFHTCKFKSSYKIILLEKSANIRQLKDPKVKHLLGLDLDSSNNCHLSLPFKIHSLKRLSRVAMRN